jgi:hypothetical protein
MNRVIFSLLAVSLVLVSGCQPQPATNSNATSSANRPTPKEEQAALTKQDKTVAIVLTNDPTNPILLVPDPITLKRSKNQQLRWCVYNDLDDPVDNVTISAFSPSDPFDPHAPFETGPIDSGNSGCTGKGKAASLGTFKYKITVIRAGQPDMVKDPGVIITD